MVGVGIGEYPPENKNVDENICNITNILMKIKKILVHKGIVNCTAGKCSPEYQTVGSYSSYQMMRRNAVIIQNFETHSKNIYNADFNT